MRNGGIGALLGQMRAVHLIAHLKTKRHVSADQVVAYNEARGYAPTSPESTLSIEAPGRAVVLWVSGEPAGLSASECVCAFQLAASVSKHRP